MAENKRSFVLYCDIHAMVKKLTDQQAGKLFKIILGYVNDEDPVVDNLVLDVAFEPIKQQLKRDLKKYVSICDRNKNNGKKGGRPTKEPKKPTGLLGNPKKPKKADNDNDNDSDISNNDKSLLPNWRSDFKIYSEECRIAYAAFMQDSETIALQERLNPGIDVRLSIEKGFVNYWSKEAGWKKKKSTKTNKIDWPATIINSIQMNKVYLPKSKMAIL